MAKKSVWQIEDGVLKRYTGNAKRVVIPKEVTEIFMNAFRNCNTIESITIPDSVEVIRTNAFLYCKNLKKVRLSNNIEKIPNGAFAWCESLEDVIIPESVTFIGSEAFKACYKLEELTIPKNVEIIASEAFEDTGLKKLRIEQRHNLKLGNNTFYGCRNLRDLIGYTTCFIKGWVSHSHYSSIHKVADILGYRLQIING